MAKGLNTDASQGSVTVSVLSDTGESLSTSNAVHDDQLDASLVWPAQFNPPRSRIRLQFKLSHAKLYSFWFAK